ncbi:MAG: MFS transporter [Pseudonocardiaceae bacterium]|nr:MFS transporter [Pseudonocardiaceae bacterium]
MTVHDGPKPASDPAARRREQRGWYWYDWANQTFNTSVTTVFGALYLTAVAKSDATANVALNGPNPCTTDQGVENSLQRCDVGIFGLQFPAGSLWGYLLSVATVVQVILLPIIGAIADRSQYKKWMLGGFAFTGATAIALMVFVSGDNWQLGAALFMIGEISWGSSIVLYYSFLPEIAGPNERDRVSARGWAVGYLGGGTALALQLVLYLNHDALGMTEEFAVRMCFLSSGVWWAAFAIIPLRRLGRHQAPHGREHGASVITAGFVEIKDTIKQAKTFPLTLAFLGTYLIYTDGISTVANVSAQYGSEELKFENEVLIVTILVIQFVAYVGAMIHGALAQRFGAKRTILGSLLGWVCVLGAAFFVAAGQPLQFYAVAVGIGLVLGGTNALSRSLYSQMVPPGKEAQYFSLYQISEKGTSWLGPLLFAGIGQATGSFRYAIIALAAFFIVGFVLLTMIPVRRAIKAVGNPEPGLV